MATSGAPGLGWRQRREIVIRSTCFIRFDSFSICLIHTYICISFHSVLSRKEPIGSESGKKTTQFSLSTTMHASVRLPSRSDILIRKRPDRAAVSSADMTYSSLSEANEKVENDLLGIAGPVQIGYEETLHEYRIGVSSAEIIACTAGRIGDAVDAAVVRGRDTILPGESTLSFETCGMWL